MRRGLVAVVASGVLAGCSAANDIPAAERGIAQFHQQLNAGAFDAIYSASGPEMKATTKQPELASFLAAVHRKLGDFQSGKTLGWNENIGTNGHFVAINYVATYARGVAQEGFAFRIDGGRAVLAGYHVNSNALILD